MFINRCYDDTNMVNQVPVADVPMSMMECPQERVCHRQICHEVNHIVPVNTKIINHHVYRHTYTPMFTCEECNTCENVYDNCPKNF